MIDNRKNMSCEQFSACMADLVAAGEDLFSHPHVRRCKLHRALLDDLQAIAKAAQQLFPEVDPPDAVWDRIQAGLGQEMSHLIVSDPEPGYRVVFAMQVMELHNPHASPPASESSIRVKVFGITRSPARREGQ